MYKLKYMHVKLSSGPRNALTPESHVLQRILGKHDINLLVRNHKACTRNSLLHNLRVIALCYFPYLNLSGL